jgi:GNAT superfamily N-acetyltransferase
VVVEDLGDEAELSPVRGARVQEDVGDAGTLEAIEFFQEVTGAGRGVGQRHVGLFGAVVVGEVLACVIGAVGAEADVAASNDARPSSRSQVPGCGSMKTVSAYSLRKLAPADQSVVAPLLVREWGAVEVAALSLGGVVDASTLPGWLAESDGEVVGLLTYLVRDDVAELVTINAFTGGGVGSALLGALVGECQTTGVSRIRVTTTNDNTPALRFYQRGGFRLTALRVGAVDEARKLKPQISSHGVDGIPIRDEIELVKELP